MIFQLPHERRKKRVFIYQNIKISTKFDSLISYMRSYRLWVIFFGRRWGLEFGQNQAKTVDKKAIFSTRERGLKGSSPKRGLNLFSFL